MSVALSEPGQLVQVRSRRWVVNEVKPSGLPAPNRLPVARPQHLVSLLSVEDDGLGEELQVIWEIEPGAKVIEKVALPEPTGFDPPDRLDAFLDAVRWGAASTADVKNIQSPFRSGIDIEDYQLDPVVRAIQMPRVNLLIADDVGLGKTIEAGMVALELIIRHRARRILVVCPSSLQVQWRDQMRDKFGLDFRIVDSELMRDLRRQRGIHVNPWSHFPRLITSHRLPQAGATAAAVQGDAARRGCFASVGMGKTDRSNKLQFRAEVLPCPRRLGSASRAQEKVAILRRHLLERIPVSDLCDEHGIHPTLFYPWQKQFFENGAAAFEPRTRRPRRRQGPDDRRSWSDKLQRKNEVVAELMEEHIKLKKELGEL